MKIKIVNAKFVDIVAKEFGITERRVRQLCSEKKLTSEKVNPDGRALVIITDRLYRKKLNEYRSKKDGKQKTL